MELSERLLKILKNNPSWIGRVYESFIISAIKDFERNNPPAHSPDFDPATNQRPYGYRHNKLFDPVSEDNGETDEHEKAPNQSGLFARQPPRIRW
ncbi:hypothetical protein SAMN05216178_5058 [Pseudomonas saponiphila]|uniref:Uncharacterized protein n=1 Tax=Pseudomonas saponiphila TaxID=556534 RepID=A0A1H4VRI8_9PSED|nr:hypothetical protein [Pseudomonas saponiphila]SEC83565.1 hypothetical protein SAMN05216178_5058 [Pseudomonas saponiphila]